MRNREEKQKAEQVEKYIDRDEAYAGQLDAETERVVNTLHRAVSETQPRPGFINELANQLREQETIMSKKSTRNVGSIFSRLLLGGAAIAALALFALYLTGLFGTPAVEPAVSESELPPRPALQIGGGEHFPEAEFEVMVPLDDAPGEVPLYTVHPGSLPQTPEEARALGERFGLDAPTLYESPSDPGRWTVLGSNGRSLSFRANQPAHEALYYSETMMPAVGLNTPTVSEEAAEAAAIAFLEAIEMLPEAYEVQNSAVASPVRSVNVSPLLDGRPLGFEPAPIQIAVGPDGQIVNARITLFSVEAVGESVPVKSAEQAFSELVEGTSPSMSYSFESAPQADATPAQYFSPPPPEYTAGEDVSLTGWVNVLVPVEGGNVQATIYTRDGSSYQLEGPLLAELATAPAQHTVQVQGQIGEQLGHRSWTVTVDSIAEAGTEPSIQCHTGQITHANGTAVLETDGGQSYPLAYLPENLDDGARAEVCAAAFSEEEPVEWLHIAAPPAGDVARAGGGGGGSSVSVRAEEVETPAESGPDAQSGSALVEREIAQQAATAQERGSGGGGSGGGIDAPGLPPSPYTVGEIVEITGIVEGVIFEEAGQRTYEITLRQEAAGEETGTLLILPLLGESQLLGELAEANRLHLDVTGQIVPAPEDRAGTHNQALIVQSFERTNPDEKVAAFLGHLEQVTADATTQTIFVDKENGQRYQLAEALYMGEEAAGQPLWVAGVVSPPQGEGELPQIRIFSSRSGSAAAEAERADAFDFDAAMPVVDREQVQQGGLHGTLVVEKAVLGYRYEMGGPAPAAQAGDAPAGSGTPVTVQPTWFFHGHTEDGATTFTIQVPATTVDAGGGRN